MNLLVCATAILVNISVLPWTDHDHEVVQSAEKGCRERYANSPCLKVFYKMDEYTYRVTCGPAEKPRS